MLLWEWLPWRRILSEEQLLEVKSRRSRSGADAAPDEWDLEIAGAALRVQHLLETRSHAFAMVGACHLHSWVVYVKKFLSLYARKPSDMFRAPTVQEAAMADRAVLDEVFQLCFSGHSLDDALSHVVVDRDMLRHVLVERPKAVSVKAEKDRFPLQDYRLCPASRVQSVSLPTWVGGVRLPSAFATGNAGSGSRESVPTGLAVSSTNVLCAATNPTTLRCAPSRRRCD